MKEAKGAENVAKAELEEAYKPSDRHARNVEEEKATARYNVAKEKCDSLTGDAKAACVNQAKADRDSAKAMLRSPSANCVASAPDLRQRGYSAATAIGHADTGQH
jgi:hypothetical protein